jgi:hypothetical protein
MLQDKMSQDEIDALVLGAKTPEIEPPIIDLNKAVKLTKKYYNLRNAMRRLMDAREFGSFADAESAARTVHKTAFMLWCSNRNMETDDYYRLMNRESAKRGLKPPFTSF